MKFLIFAFIIAFILEDHGIFSAKTIDQYSPGEQIELFKKYALKLVHAAAKPLRKNGDIMVGGSKCILGIDMDEKEDSFDVYLATMSLAKDYYEELQLMLANSKVDPKDGLMKSIRLILVILQSSPDIFEDFDGIQTLKRYLVRKKQNPSTGSSVSAKSFESEIQCYRAMLNIAHEHNAQFFETLINGFKIGNAMMLDNDKDFDKDPTMKIRRAELDEIVKKISANENALKTPPATYKQDIVDKFTENLLTKASVSDFEFDPETDSDSD